MKNLHLLPTDKPSRLWITWEKQLGLHPTITNSLLDKQHIYITSDEKPEAGHYYFDSLVHFSLINYPLKHSGGEYENVDKSKIIQSTVGTTSPMNTSSKIILTTDQDLIKDGVQAIDDEFLEWFVKNPSCESVEIGKKCNYGECICYLGKCQDNENIYKIITPQEEPKQETLEEAAERISDKCKLDAHEIEPFINGFIECAKWQEERIPSIIEEYLETAFISKEQGYMNPKEWFKQFKKK